MAIKDRQRLVDRPDLGSWIPWDSWIASRHFFPPNNDAAIASKHMVVGSRVNHA